MSNGIVDTTVLVHHFRKHPEARAWIASQTAPLSITTISWMEIMEGAQQGAASALPRITGAIRALTAYRPHI